ncbi:hypothetical protein SEA_RAMIEL05_64 [Microbacterium phage Ramiel05]|uniref:Uncharacterized protein n=2 Tax=Quhwahvirus paschalis TaxID=2182400 RepID=A0A2U8UPL1_9CAUD|nr:membrane protein [Microbacterium phage Paschalis]QDP45459.1 hypothetical protein SEA_PIPERSANSNOM_66 [Microbacterium phage PiperSansNom]URM86273.1 hypothetical protein SEA_KOWALSKI_64 [Microbacterium phage Kowalski]URM86882.1 hypothetical protein SEA_RAMIEL05_64 [Microbacterium phage Ramiel05]WGH20654.1 hypothetical protein SEA_BRAZZALEPHS_64 [Microbacterium phage BrazzalePHS]AWN05558.1 hypothetical protein SEA_PASCHALIS_65 [Microbacterium phage Paschalis]
MDWPLIASHLIVGTICLLGGSALGNYTAHADIERTTCDQAE